MIRSNPLGAQHDEADVIEPSDSLFNHDELVEKVMAAHEGEEEVDKQLSDSSSSKAALSDHEKGDTVLSQVASEFVTPSHEEVATSKIEEVATSKIEDEATSMIEEVATSKIEEAATSKVEGSSTSAAPVVDVRLDPQAPVSDSSSHTAVRPPEFGEETTDSFMMPRSLSIEEEAERRLSHMESDGKSVFSVKTRRGDKEAVPAAYWERKLMKKNLSEWTLRRPDELFQPRQYQILMHIPQPQSSLSGSTDGPSAVQTTGLQTPRRGFGSRAAPELVSKSGSMAAPELASKSGSRAGPELVSKSGSRSVAVSGSSLAGVAKDKRSGVSSTPIQSGTLDGIKSGSRSGIRSEVRSTVSVARSKPELESSVGSETDAKFVRPIPEYVDRMEFRRRLLLQQDVSGLLLNPMGSVPEWVVKLNAIPRGRLESYRIGEKNLFRIDDTLDLGRPTHAYFPPTIVRLYPDGVLLPDPKLFANRDVSKDADKDNQQKSKYNSYIFTEQLSFVESWIRAGKRDPRRRKLKPVPDYIFAQRQAHAHALLRVMQQAAYEGQESESSSTSTSGTSTFGSDEALDGISVAGPRTARASERKTLNTPRRSERRTLNTPRRSERKTLDTPRRSETTLNTARRRKRTLETLHPSCNAEHEPLGCDRAVVRPRTSVKSPEDLLQRSKYRSKPEKIEKIARKGKRRQPRVLPKMFEHGLLSAEDLSPLETLDFLYTGITPEYSGVTPIDSHR